MKIGFDLFRQNFAQHMKNAVSDWLFGELGSTDLKLPKKFNAKGLFSIVLQVIGLTEDNIFKRIEKKIGKDKADKVRVAYDTIKTYLKEGVAGLWKLAEQKMDSLRKMLVDQIISWVQEKIIAKAMVKLATMFIPFAGLIQAVKTLWETIQFIKKNVFGCTVLLFVQETVFFFFFFSTI